MCREAFVFTALYTKNIQDWNSHTCSYVEAAKLQNQFDSYNFIIVTITIFVLLNAFKTNTTV